MKTTGEFQQFFVSEISEVLNKTPYECNQVLRYGKSRKCPKFHAEKLGVKPEI